MPIPDIIRLTIDEARMYGKSDKQIIAYLAGILTDPQDFNDAMAYIESHS